MAKQYLDMHGLDLLWAKIKSTFSSKKEVAEVNNKFGGQMKLDISNGGIRGSDGTLYDSPERARSNNFIFCKAGSTVKWTGDYHGYVDYYSSPRVEDFITLSASYITELTIPYDCYVLVACKRTDDAAITDLNDVAENMVITTPTLQEEIIGYIDSLDSDEVSY